VTRAPYTLEFYEDDDGDEPVLRWLRGLTPRKRRAMGVALYEILQHEGPNVVGTNFGKPIGGGIFEFRLDQDATEVLARKGKRAKPETSEPAKILLRVFCHAHGNKIVLLLAGYDKGERPSPHHQQEQIEVAKQRLKSWKARQVTHRSPGRGDKPQH
jgi:putative component of toxin-antitoxin plasmid stabilization module